MTPWELLLATALYVSVGVRYAMHDDPGMALMFMAYGLANVGLLWSTMSKV